MYTLWISTKCMPTCRMDCMRISIISPFFLWFGVSLTGSPPHNRTVYMDRRYYRMAGKREPTFIYLYGIWWYNPGCVCVYVLCLCMWAMLHTTHACDGGWLLKWKNHSCFIGQTIGRYKFAECHFVCTFAEQCVCQCGNCTPIECTWQNNSLTHTHTWMHDFCLCIMPDIIWIYFCLAWWLRIKHMVSS